MRKRSWSTSRTTDAGLPTDPNSFETHCIIPNFAPFLSWPRLPPAPGSAVSLPFSNLISLRPRKSLNKPKITHACFLLRRFRLLFRTLKTPISQNFCIFWRWPPTSQSFSLFGISPRFRKNFSLLEVAPHFAKFLYFWRRLQFCKAFLFLAAAPDFAKLSYFWREPPILQNFCIFFRQPTILPNFSSFGGSPQFCKTLIFF